MQNQTPRQDSNEQGNENISHWNIKLYENREEQETIRHLTTITKDVLMDVFNRLGVAAQAMAYTSDGKYADQSETVNRHRNKPRTWFPDGYNRTQATKDPYDVSAKSDTNPDELTADELKKLFDVYEDFEIDWLPTDQRLIRGKIQR